MSDPVRQHKRKLHIANDIPPDQWCDFRIDYESGMSLREIAGKYICDSRTVRSAIIYNKSSKELGRKMTPSILMEHESEILELLENQALQTGSVYQLSCRITEALATSGYTGSERTVRNYLKSHPQLFSKEKNEHDPDQ